MTIRKIGLIGGTGPESTALYYRELNRRIFAQSGGTAYPEITVESINVYDALADLAAGQFDRLADRLAGRIFYLKQGGAEVIALTAVTMHAVYDRLLERTGLPLVGIPDAVCAYARERGYRTVGLLGTSFTMKNDYMKRPFAKAGIRVCVPTDAGQILVADRIDRELERGIVRDATREEIRGVIREMKREAGIEAVILGCTELPLLFPGGASEPADPDIEALDSVDLHIRELIRRASE